MSSHILHRGAEKACINSSIERGYEGTAARSWRSTAWWPYSTDWTQRWGGRRSRKTTAVTQVWNTVSHVEKVLFTVCVEIAIFKDSMCVGPPYHLCDTSHFISLFYLCWHSSLSDGAEMSWISWKSFRGKLSNILFFLCCQVLISLSVSLLSSRSSYWNYKIKKWKKGIETKRMIEMV